MPKTTPNNQAVVEDLRAVYNHMNRAKGLLDREDSQQLEAWGELDQAEARLSGLPILLR